MLYGRIEKTHKRRRCACHRLRPQPRTAALPNANCRCINDSSIQSRCAFRSPNEIQNVHREDGFGSRCAADAREKKDALADRGLRVPAAGAD